MRRQVTFSRYFPELHPNRAVRTGFIVKMWVGINIVNNDLSGEAVRKYVDSKDIHPEREFYINNYFQGDEIKPKFHTIRKGKKWNVGDILVPCFWKLDGGRFTKGNSKVQFAPELKIEKVWDFRIDVKTSKVSKILTQKDEE